MSGDLKKPSKSIPRGTLYAVFVTFLQYVIMTILIASTTNRSTLVSNFTFLSDVRVIIFNSWFYASGQFRSRLGNIGHVCNCHLFHHRRDFK